MITPHLTAIGCIADRPKIIMKYNYKLYYE